MNIINFINLISMEYLNTKYYNIHKTSYFKKTHTHTHTISANFILFNFNSILLHFLFLLLKNIIYT